jgi:hypothetical protein
MKESTKLPSATFSSESEVHLIFVFAGLEARKSYGLQLLHERPASIILLSVGRFEIRKLPNLNLPVVIDLLKLAASIPTPLRHFFVWFENGSAFAERIQIGRFGTMSDWQHGCKSGRRFVPYSLSAAPIIFIEFVFAAARCCPTEYLPGLLPLRKQTNQRSQSFTFAGGNARKCSSKRASKSLSTPSFCGFTAEECSSSHARLTGRVLYMC